MSIILIPIGKVNPADITMLEEPLEAIFSQSVATGKRIALPAAAWNTARNQYDAKVMLEFLSLSGRLPATTGCWESPTSISIFRE